MSNNVYTLSDGTAVPDLPTFLADERFSGAPDLEKRGIMQNYVHKMGAVLGEMYPDDKEKQIEEHNKFAKVAYESLDPSTLDYIGQGAKSVVESIAGSGTAIVGLAKDGYMGVADTLMGDIKTGRQFDRAYPFVATARDSVSSWANWFYRKSPFDGVSIGEAETMVDDFVSNFEYYANKASLSEKKRIEILKDEEQKLLDYSKRLNGDENYEARSLFSQEDTYLKSLLHSYMRTKDPNLLQAIRNHYTFSEKQKELDDKKANLVDYLNKTGQGFAAWGIEYADVGEIATDLVSGGVGAVIGKTIKGVKMASKLRRGAGAVAVGAFGEGSMEYAQASRDGASDSEKWDSFIVGAIAGGALSGIGGVVGYNAYKQNYLLNDIKQRLKAGDHIDKVELSSLLNSAGLSSNSIMQKVNKAVDSMGELDVSKKLPENYSKAFEGKNKLLQQEYISRLASSVVKGEDLDADGKKVWKAVEKEVKTLFSDKKLDSSFIADFVSKTALKVDENLANAVVKDREQRALEKKQANSWTASMPSDESLQAEGTYDLVESSDLLPNTDASISPEVKKIAKNLNPSKLQVSDTTDTGAPILNQDGQIISGNKRAAAINKVYDSNPKKAKEYKDSVIKKSVSLGMDPAKAEQMKRPVLVRKADNLANLTDEEFSQQSNSSSNLEVEEYASASEVAGSVAQEEGSQSLDAKFDELYQRYQKGDQVAAQEALELLDSVVEQKGLSPDAVGDVFTLDEKSELVPLSKRFQGANVDNDTHYEQDVEGSKGESVEEVNAKAIPSDMPSDINSPTIIERLKAWAMNKYDGKVVKMPNENGVLKDVLIDKKGIRESMNHLKKRVSADKKELFIRTIPSIIEILEKAKFVDKPKNKHNQKLDVFKYESRFKCDGENYKIDITIKENLQGKFYYDHNLTKIRTLGALKSSDVKTSTSSIHKKESNKNLESQEKSSKNSNISPDDSFDQNTPSSLGHMALDLPELVSLFKSLVDKYPIVSKFMETEYNGVFYPATKEIHLNMSTADYLTRDEQRRLEMEALKLLSIQLDFKGGLGSLYALCRRDKKVATEFESLKQSLFDERRQELKEKASPIRARKTLAHEIGHLLDFLDDNNLDTGNVLGHLASIKKYMEQSIKDAQGNEYYAKVINEELISLSLWWRRNGASFDSLEVDDQVYISNPAELYADAFSVLANAPHILEERAPSFYNAFVSFMQARPNAMNKYKKVQDLLRSGTDMLQAERLSNIDKMLNKSTAHVEEKAKTSQSWSDWWNEFAVKYLDKWQPIYRQIKRHLNELPHNYYDEMMHVLKSLDYRNTNHEFYLKTLNTEVLNVISNVGLNIEELSRYMFLMHIRENRSDIYSSMGHTYKSACDTLAGLEKSNKEQYDALVKAQENWWQLRKKMVIEPLKKSGIFTKELMEIIELRSYYTPFVPQESKAKTFDKKIDEIIAKDLGISDSTIKAHVHKQLGFLGEVKSPAETLLAKDLALMDFVLRNNAAKSVVSMMKETDSGLITSALKQNGEIKEATKSVGLISYMENGKVNAFFVPKTFADGFNSTPDPDAAISLFGKFNNAVKALYTQLAPGFWPVALSRDIGAIHFRVPTENVLSVRNIPIIGFIWDMLNVVARIPAAYRSVYSNEDVRNMLSKQLVISHRESTGGSGVIESSILRELNAFRIDAKYPITHKGYSAALDKLVNSLSGIKNFYFSLGQVGERASKIYATDLVEKNKSLSDEAKANIVRMHGGSPDFLAQGIMAKKVDCAFLFFNPIVQGYKSVPDVIARDKMSLWRLASMVAPSLAFSLASEGELGEEVLGVLASMMGESPEELRAMTQAIPLYDRVNYHCVPFYWEDKEQGKVFYLRIPLTEEVRLSRGLLYSGAKGEGLKDSFSSATSYAGGYLPSVNPILSYSKTLIDYYVMDENPRDNFRNKNILDDYTFVAGGKDAALVLAKKGWNDLGGTMVHRFKDDSIYTSNQGALEKFLSLPAVSSTFARFFKVSNQGFSDEARLRSNAYKSEIAPSKKLQKSYVKDILDGNMTPEKWQKLDASFSSQAEKRSYVTALKQSQKSRESFAYATFSKLNISKEGKRQVLQKMIDDNAISRELATEVFYHFNMDKP